MAKTTVEMTHEEFLDWATGLVLQRLLAGDLRGGVYLVIDQATQRAIPIRGRRKAG